MNTLSLEVQLWILIIGITVLGVFHLGTLLYRLYKWDNKGRYRLTKRESGDGEVVYFIEIHKCIMGITFWELLRHEKPFPIVTKEIADKTLIELQKPSQTYNYTPLK
jgi:hypothetical protein